MLATDDALLRDGVLARERRALAKTITLIESTRDDHQVHARAVLGALLPHTGRSLRIGITGVPGVGKSTFIEAFGLQLIEQGSRVAVLAVDPTSSLSGGSILGDKTRMEHLSTHASAFVRPSPAGGALGGVAARTREAMLACEAAGFDIVIVETVGVGQSETAVAGMTDVFVLLQLPNAGDELQSMKKGVVELADIVVINKADIDARAAESARGNAANALMMLRPSSPHWSPPVLLASALTGAGIDALWRKIDEYRTAMQAHGEFDAKRKRQALAWMWQIIDESLRGRFRAHARVQQELTKIAAAVASGETSASAAAARLLALYATDEPAR
ncbi:MAG: methylmalonyl Co-A mutase-associated GTPase MeaB [Betaproteobacteria bacterium]|nr:methylmalonyl Co-A mutase-associated GTPase MeaB [Betaproteobacteria bacterium]